MDTLRHISMRCQLNRLHRKEAVLKLFNGKYDKKRLYSISDIQLQLKSEPFEILDPQEMQKFSIWLIQNESEKFLPADLASLKSSGQDIANKMYINLDHWNPLTEEMEEQFDTHIRKVISQNKNEIL